MSRIDREFIERLRSKCHSGDTEGDHSLADKILIEFLRKHTYTELADEYEKVDKWYA